eukprot:135137_1
MAEAVKLFDNENVMLDSFQQTLLQMTTNASATALSKFFSKNYRPLYQFILRLYLTSLTSEHPDRGHSSKHKQDTGYTIKEHKILAEWANLLTDDEPLNNDDTLLALHNTSSDNNDDKSQSSPQISSSNTSKVALAYAKVSDKKKNKRDSKHGHNKSSQSFSGMAHATTHIAVIQNTPNTRTAYGTYGTKRKSKTGKKVGFGADVSEQKSHDDMKTSYKKNRDGNRRDSIWDGVLDINNIIMVPETPKWRPRFSFQQNQLLQEGLLDSILSTISPKDYDKGKTERQLTLSDECEVTSVDAMCLYLPLMCVISSKFDVKKNRDQLQIAILQRVMKEDDVKQTFQFFLNSYKNASDIKKQFNKTNHALMKQKSTNTPNTDSHFTNTPTFSSASSPSIMNDDLPISKTTSLNLNESGKKAQQIIQQTPESAIYLFQSIFRQSLLAGSEIKLCRESQVKDPINCHAPPLSRIEIRKIIATNSKPYLIDLYVANRSDNFEYLSSTVILKKGDDLRRDAAVLHVFRLMNKIWREQGLDFMQVPVNALTYKCIAMSPDFGIIELVEGCKPLRLVSALEDTITIAQQFNLVASATGSYMASYIMGVRDRHFDNVLIRDIDCRLFHIDFGFVLGDTAGVDTSKFAITKDLKKLMGVFWDKFIELSVQAFLSLRQKHKYLIKYARIAFEYLENGDTVEEFIKHQLRIDDMSDDKAAKYVARKLKESPGSAKTKFKNVVHQIATMKK